MYKENHNYHSDELIYNYKEESFGVDFNLNDLNKNSLNELLNQNSYFYIQIHVYHKNNSDIFLESQPIKINQYKKSLLFFDDSCINQNLKNCETLCLQSDGVFDNATKNCNKLYVLLLEHFKYLFNNRLFKVRNSWRMLSK